MSSRSKYSDTEIEQKRLLALGRKKLAQKGSGVHQESQKSFNPLRSGSKNSWKSYNNENKRTWNPSPVRTQSQSNRYNPMKTKEPQNFFSKQSSIHLKCVMTADNRFSVNVSAFQQEVIDIFKTISSKSYDVKTRIWEFHIKDYDALMNKLFVLKPRVTVEGLPNKILQIFKKDINTDYSSIDLSTIDPKLVETFMPFQRAGVCYGISKNGRCFIADDMGLGKTLQALGIAHYYKDDWPLLIVSPSSVRYQWAAAIYKFLPSIPAQYVHHFANAKDVVGDANVVIMSYDIMSRAIATIERHVFGVIIFDESHFLKTYKSARTQAATCIAAQARRIILLSGTPALSRPMELYSQLCLIQPKFLGGVHEFGIRYCAGTLGNFGWEYGGSSNLQELQLLLRRCGLIRRMKSEVLKQLPSKMREVVTLDPKLIKAETVEMKKLAANYQRNTLSNAERETTKIQYFRETAQAKLKAICNYVVDLLENRNKFLIFAHHAIVLNGICEVLVSKKIRYIRIDGSTKSDDRKTQCDLFQEQDDCLVAVLSITAANAGITLTAAQRVIFAELYWNPGIVCQAEDRVHRIGQQGSVHIQFLIAKNTADDHIWPTLQTKLDILGRAGIGQNFSLQSVAVQPQTEKGQTNLNSYITKVSSQPKPNCEQNLAAENDEELSRLLEIDDDDLTSMDLDIAV